MCRVSASLSAFPCGTIGWSGLSMYRARSANALSLLPGWNGCRALRSASVSLRLLTCPLSLVIRRRVIVPRESGEVNTTSPSTLAPAHSPSHRVTNPSNRSTIPLDHPKTALLARNLPHILPHLPVFLISGKWILPPLTCPNVRSQPKTCLLSPIFAKVS